MKNNPMSQALHNVRAKGVDVAIIIGGGDDLDEANEEVQEKELGLAPDAEPLEGEMNPGEMAPQGEIQDLGALLENDPGSIGALGRRAMMKKGK